MSEEKAICAKCGKEVTDNVWNYSVDKYGIPLCYPCQELVRTGKLNIETLKEALKKKEKDTLEGYVSSEEEELKRFDEELNEEANAEVVDAEVVEEEDPESRKQKWDKTVETDAGVFSFRSEGGMLLCKNGANDNIYTLNVEKPHCSCNDFVVNKKGKEWCKHLKAAKAAGHDVKELPKVPVEVEKALPKPEPEKQKRRKGKKEESIALTVMGQEIEMAVQTPVEVIQNEEMAAKMIRSIVGPNPQFKDVIEKFGDIEEVSADVIISVAQYAGIRFQILSKEIETTKMNLGKIFQVIPMKEDKKKYYEGVAGFMPDTDVVVRCKITSVAAWKDKAGNLRVGVGTKEEHLTPYELKDMVMRGANFIETKCESKAFKKSILNALPVTHDGLLQKIKATYGW